MNRLFGPEHASEDLPEMVWREEYAIGEADIDAQHRMFVSLINRLRAAIKQQIEQDALVPLLHEIKKYAEFHFASEENYMYTVRYPGRNEHAAIHSVMLSELSLRILKARQSWRNSGPLLGFLVTWLREHIAREDRKIAAYVATLRAGDGVTD